MWVERFPVSILLGAQLAGMVALPAVLNGTQPLGLILGICGLAVIVAAYCELLMLPLRPVVKPFKPVSLKAARFILAVGAVAELGSTLGGRGTYAVQLGSDIEGSFVTLLSPFAVWLLFGAVLYLWLYREGLITRRKALAVVAAVSVIETWVGFERAIFGQAASFVLTLLVMSVFVRLIRLRVIVVVLLLIPIFWPPIYGIRDAIRLETVGHGTSVSANDALGRLQLDKLMANVGALGVRPAGLNPPSALTLIRTGILPRFIDRDRPPLDTGTRMSVALGGSATNSQTATMFGNAYVLEGWFGVVAVAVALAITMGAALRRKSPWALIFTALIYWYGISFNASYPNALTQILQASTSLLFVYLGVRFFSRDASRSARRSGRMVTRAT